MTTPPDQSQIAETAESAPASNNTKIIGFVVVLCLLAVAAFTLPIADWFTALAQWIDENRSISWLVFMLVYIVATVLILPGSLLTLAAGCRKNQRQRQIFSTRQRGSRQRLCHRVAYQAIAGVPV